MKDIIIVGAGLAGSGLAHALARQGWDVLLIERDVFPRHKVCGEFLSPESQGSLAALGLRDTVAALEPTRMVAAALTARAGRTLRVGLPGEAWGVSRYALDAALAQAAERAGAELRCGVGVSAVKREADAHYTVMARGGRETVAFQARAVVIACGRHPARALRAVPLRDPERTAVGVKCHFTGVASGSDVELYLFDGGYVGLAPVEDGRLNLCMLASRRAMRRAGGAPRSLLEATMTWNPALGRRLAGGVLIEETLVSVAPVDTGDHPAPWHGAPRLGDAAVMIPPLCGDGQAMALRSAELCAPLADALLRGRLTFDQWEKAYRTAWRREFEGRVRVARLLQRALVAPGLAEAAVATGALFPPLARAMVHATRGRAHATGG
jgi:flavin-dependent dehydrogenase